MAQRTSKSTLADSGQLRKRYGRERRASGWKHDALLCRAGLKVSECLPVLGQGPDLGPGVHDRPADPTLFVDRKSTRLNSSHVAISYAVFCLKKKITTKS